MDQSSLLLGQMSVEDFLDNHWQKKPMIFRQVFSPQQLNIMSVDELSGLALEEHIESRLIIANTAAANQSEPLTLQHGPLSVETLTQLPESDWTLLIQSVDLWDEKFRSLLDWANFIPSWRLDDIMVSIAAPGGGVGPHRDQYDVFLLQMQGERHWLVSQPNQDEDILCGGDLLQVPPFKGEIDQVLAPGDVLYVPPGWRHWGVAKSLCVTTSIGFRAPSAEDLILSLSDQLSNLSTKRFDDSWRKAGSGQGINQQDIEEVRAKINSIVEDDFLLAEALGLQVTQPKIATEAEENDEILLAQEKVLKDTNLEFSLHPHSRMSYFQSDKGITLFVNGETLNTKLDANCKQLIEQLCKHQLCTLSQFKFNQKSLAAVKQLLAELVQIDALSLA